MLALSAAKTEPSALAACANYAENMTGGSNMIQTIEAVIDSHKHV